MSFNQFYHPPHPLTRIYPFMGGYGYQRAKTRFYIFEETFGALTEKNRILILSLENPIFNDLTESEHDGISTYTHRDFFRANFCMDTNVENRRTVLRRRQQRWSR